MLRASDSLTSACAWMSVRYTYGRPADHLQLQSTSTSVGRVVLGCLKISNTLPVLPLMQSQPGSSAKTNRKSLGTIVGQKEVDNVGF
ncbi:hypothetical protein M438DRAFT_347781 [Aureobasidium pullulans EXF-150]|uniref:Uncharacterized protein n=1 Tax=Aureobasidium pullulans EXF-150 TaxID=1043002 RepID=A0A074X861_AURPU|nr:uncharacterized protein M438DRAFT_347781 [Aureobasidium pullulans EXF-150]KEQ81670.1 hypothetical protein M438DRAFT_347781 [Aureobasidium pullulans EXF-150]